MATIEIRKDKRGQFRFTVKSRNGEVVATGESYKQKAKALQTARSLKISGAKIVDVTVEPKTAPAKKSANAPKKAVKKSSKKTVAKSRGGGSARRGTSAKTALRSPGDRKAAGGATKLPAKRSAPSGRNKGGAPKPARETAARRMPTEADRPASSGGVRSPATGPSRILTTPHDDPRERDADDLDTLEMPEGSDIVSPEQLGDGDQIATDLDAQNTGDREDADGGGGPMDDDNNDD